MKPAPNEDMKVTSGKYVFKYTGDVEYMSLNTLLASQIHFLQALTEIKEQIHPDKELDIRVKALPPGSFQIEILLDINFIEHLFSSGLVSYATDIIGAFSDLTSLMGFLGGKKPAKVEKKGDRFTFVAKDGGTINVNQNIYHIYENSPSILKEIAETYKPIANDEEIDGVTIIEEDTKTTMLDVPRDDFKNLVVPEVDERVKKADIRRSIEIVVYKPVLDTGLKKWQFYMEGHLINASVHDSEFLAKMAQGQALFGVGDVMVVDIEIENEWDERVAIYLPKAYKILKVHSHRHKDKFEQGNLFREDDAPNA